MRLEHLVFYLGIAASTPAPPDIAGALPVDAWNLEERTAQFVKTRLIPALTKVGVSKVNFSNVHLCYCSLENGCHARTNGWVGGIEELTEHEKVLYKNTCYTDGDCYQTARPAPELSLFGCMDMNSATQETDFHDTAAHVCANTTKGIHRSSWICCEGNYCANETTMFLPAIVGDTRSSSVLMAIVSFFLLSVLALTCLTVFIVYDNPLKTKLILLLTRRAVKIPKEDDEEEELEDFPPIEPSHDIQYMPVTMSTTPGSFNTNKDIPPHMVEFFKVLDETSIGSEDGDRVMHELTIGWQITMQGKIGEGAFGNVSVGEHRGEQVAVKVFNSTNQSSFEKEVRIYETSMLRHQNVLRYIGSDRLYKNNTIQLWLVTEFHACGSLHDFLSRNEINLQSWYNLMRTAACGLDFLHTEIGGNENENSNKPSIAHRDLKSRNIMVRSDFTCCIGDLGLSLSWKNKNGKVPETNPKCGTVRYLSPEILDNTLHSEDFESYLKTDMYAFTLVMWETLCRCQHENILPKEPAKAIPYIEYTNRDPTDQEMHEVVVKQNRRPTIDPAWAKHPDFEHILDIMNTGWNGHPYARYTAYQLKKKLSIGQRAITLKEAHMSAAARSQQIRESPRRIPQRPTNQLEAIQMTPLASWVARVHDQGTVENRNAPSRSRDEMHHPLL